MLKDLIDGFRAYEDAETRTAVKISFTIDRPIILAFVIGKLEPQPRACRECRIPNEAYNPLTSIFAQDCLPELERKIAHNRDKHVRGALRSWNR